MSEPLRAVDPVGTAPPERVLGRVLCVDDEPFVLDGLRRALHRKYELVVTSSPAEALELVTAAPDEFDVVVSDLKMPGTDGITLLSELRQVAPASVRILLTGHGDLNSAMDAVNRGNIFRFLCKPASRAELISALDAASDQHRLIVAERELLEQTLRGSVAALMETLALANPAAFARSGRVNRIVAALADAAGAKGWELEVAGLCSQIGAVTIGADVVAKLETGAALTPGEREAVDAVPAVSVRLLATIPRLEEVRRIIRYQDRRYDGQGVPAAENDGVAGGDLPVGSRILKVALDLDALESRGLDRDAAVGELRGRAGHYDPDIIERLDLLDRPAVETVRLGALKLRPGMVIAADVCDTDGVLMVPRGREITESLIPVMVGYVKRGRVADGFTVSGVAEGTGGP
jgi:response regulator RpfG family c-di-GMP phosphodiesterase